MKALRLPVAVLACSLSFGAALASAASAESLRGFFQPGLARPAVAAGGELDGERYLSAAAVREMTRRQTPAAVRQSHGVGWTDRQGGFGHGGALNTEASTDVSSGLITIFLVQQSGFIGEGAKLRPEFQRVARERFAGKSSTEREAPATATTTGATAR